MSGDLISAAKQRPNSRGTISRISAWMAGGSLSRQFSLIFRSFAILVILLGVAAALGFLRVEQRAERLSDLTDFAFNTASMSRAVTVSKDQMGAYRARNFAPELIADSIAKADEAIALNKDIRVAAQSIDPAYIPRIDELDADLARIKAIMGEIRDAPRSIVQEESFLGPRYDTIDATVAKIVALREDANGRVEEFASEGRGEVNTLLTVMVVAALLILGLVFFGQHVVRIRIIQPIGNISDAGLALSEGRTGIVIPETGRRDEIGTMARSLTVMQDKTNQLIALEAEAARTAKDELDTHKARQSARDEQVALLQRLADRFEKGVGDVASEVASASNQLNSMAGDLAGQAEDAARQVNSASDELREASSGVTGAAAASDEFAMSIAEISRQAADSAQLARQAAKKAEEADRQVGKMTESAAEVSNVVEMIASIAQRTNLLALNASIEAARGGEAGRGFAVVATEVKELAGQTARATQEAERLIAAIQADTGGNAAALQAIGAEVQELEARAVSIAAAVDQQSIAGKSLAQSIDLAARSTESVADSVRTVSAASTTTGATASQVLESCRHLEGQAAQLRAQVGEFVAHIRSA